MGRRKISIEPLQDARSRIVTFSRRRAGIAKKARELAVLTGSRVLVIIADLDDRLSVYSTDNCMKHNDKAKSPRESLADRYVIAAHTGTAVERFSPTLSGESENGDEFSAIESDKESSGEHVAIHNNLRPAQTPSKPKYRQSTTSQAVETMFAEMTRANTYVQQQEKIPATTQLLNSQSPISPQEILANSQPYDSHESLISDHSSVMYSSSQQQPHLPSHLLSATAQQLDTVQFQQHLLTSTDQFIYTPYYENLYASQTMQLPISPTSPTDKFDNKIRDYIPSLSVDFAQYFQEFRKNNENADKNNILSIQNENSNSINSGNMLTMSLMMGDSGNDNSTLMTFDFDVDPANFTVGEYMQ